MTSPSDERVCIDCEHVSHLGSECDVPVGYDHLNGDHECGCPGTSDLLAEWIEWQEKAERYERIIAEYDAGGRATARAEKAEADLRVLREGIKALADRVHAHEDFESEPAVFRNPDGVWEYTEDAIRALLTKEE